MKDIREYLNEGIFNKDLVDKNIFNDKPKTKDELIDTIEAYINAINPKDTDTIDLNWIDVSRLNDLSNVFDTLGPYTKTSVMWGRQWRQKYKGWETWNFDVSKWDVSNCENFTSMFSFRDTFNCDLSKWDMSNAKSTRYMFRQCKKFNSDLSKWNVSNCEDFIGMFEHCDVFKSDLSKWNMSNAQRVSSMFFYCKKFNSDLSKWDLKKVRYDNMSDMFFGCDSLQVKNMPDKYLKMKNKYLKKKTRPF